MTYDLKALGQRLIAMGAPGDYGYSTPAGKALLLAHQLLVTALSIRPPSQAAVDVLAERERRIEGEGWIVFDDEGEEYCPEHPDEQGRQGYESVRRSTTAEDALHALLTESHAALTVSQEREARAAEALELFEALRDNSWDLRCFAAPTGGDDHDIGWRVIGHWQAEPQERVVAEVFNDDPAEAVRKALATLKEQKL